MKFSKIIGKIDQSLVTKAEEKLSQIFLELGTRYDNKHVGSQMGGDPLIFTLMYPVEHICTLNIATAATDGKRYYWNPKFVLKQSKIGLRLICGHEAWHAIFTHPQRRGSRNPKLWNIAVDYIVNGTAMDDLTARKMDPVTTFTKNLGRYMTIDNYCELLKNPFGKIAGFEDVSPGNDPNATIEVELPNPSEDRELTEQEKRELERREKSVKFYYADPNLSEEMKSPEKIYDTLLKLIPKCEKCGRLGMYKLPQKKNKQGKQPNKKQENKSKDKQKSSSEQGQEQDKSQDQNHDHGGDQPCGCPSNGQPQSGQGNDCCDGCGDGVDIFGLGGTVDDHIDTEESQEKLAKRIANAMETARRMAGHVPAGLETELGILTAPKITWQDIIRTRLLKARAGNGRNDWTRFRTRPLFTGLLVPKRRSYHAHFGCLLDTSGSMSKDDKAFGLSQLISLDERSEGTIVPADSVPYWEDATKIKKCNIEELTKVKATGGGGTMFAPFFDDYEKNIGKCDFLIILTDGYLLDSDIAEMKNPGIDVLWIVTSGASFTAPFGRVFSLKD